VYVDLGRDISTTVASPPSRTRSSPSSRRSTIGVVDPGTTPEPDFDGRLHQEKLNGQQGGNGALNDPFGHGSVVAAAKHGRLLHRRHAGRQHRSIMRTHPVLSEHILAGVGLSPIVLQVARSSHERVDGQGYPDGLSGEHVPLPARIVLVADAFDALTSDRSYRKGTTAERAIEEIRAHAGTQFCPRVVAALERVYREEPGLLGATRLRVVAG
jgi:hypothetical protein